MFKLPHGGFVRLRGYAYLSIFILTVIALTYAASAWFEGNINRDWEQISAEKNLYIRNECISLFDSYTGSTVSFSSELLRNKKLIQSFRSQNVRKAFEYLFEHENIDEFNVEMYNSRLELFLYSGRQLNPEISELKRALDGQKFSSVKEIGFYTYIMVFEPVRFDSASGVNTLTASDGVLVTAKLLDTKYNIINKYFTNEGISQEISVKYGLNLDFDFRRYLSYTTPFDSSYLKENIMYEVKNINNEVIGNFFVPQLDKWSYLQNVEKNFDGVRSFLLFFLSVIILLGVKHISGEIKSGYIKDMIFILAVIIARYVWLLIGFPTKIFSTMGIFSPVHYASSAVFGAAGSLGELLISTVALIFVAVYVVNSSVNRYRAGKAAAGRYASLLVIIFWTFIFFMSLYIYGIIVQSLVYDSNLGYIDRSQILSTDQPELLVAMLTVLMLTFSLVLILITSVIFITKYSGNYLRAGSLKSKRFKEFLLKNLVLPVFLILLAFNAAFELVFTNPADITIPFAFRTILIVLVFILAFWVLRNLNARKKQYRFNTILNFSFVTLICALFVPGILLNNIISQEKKYLELIAKNISEQEYDKINFLILSSLDDVQENPGLEFELEDKNKYPKLAFNIWTGSKLNTEDLNTAVIVLDTSLNIISDFNINPAELNSDSVVLFTLRNMKESNASSGMNQAEDVSDEEEEGDVFDAQQILQNEEMKFYCGIIPLEKTDLKMSKFKRILGYVIIAAQYDAKNFLSQSSMQIFTGFTRDNMMNKLTSSPVISEFSDGELVGSSSKDISRSFIRSIPAFREGTAGRTDVTAFRYDEFEGQLYKSIYTLKKHAGYSDISSEKIYIVSLRQNDFELISFFMFKFLLFVVVVYLIAVVILVLFRVSAMLLVQKSILPLRFGFREKIFASFFLVSVIPIIILALYSREFATEKNNEFYMDQMKSDLRIMEQYVKNRYTMMEMAKTRKLESEELIRYSSFFEKGFTESDKNFNLFYKNRLVATTNEQLYKSDLLDTRLSSHAYYNIVILKKDFYQEKQIIGALSVLAGYKPIYDKFNNLTAIISSQTVFRQNEINRELTESLVYIFGVYFVAVIFLILIVNVLSYKISNPIIKLQKATEQISKGNTEIQVEVSTKDEIGELVKSFNRMTRELKRSRIELKRAERESAWRDIARQVAHEIKNPLTPIKLAMQHLYSAYTNSSKDFKSIIQTTNRLITDQIETLNRIATDFSDFAKMPSRNFEALNVDEILFDVVKLLNTNGRIKLMKESTSGNDLVMGDRDEVQRVFINVIRNSLHAIDRNVCDHDNGIVEINTKSSNGFHSVLIKDNGVGMSGETLGQLFEPYFSTKSSGMGLGLVITKMIIDDMKGKINIKSVPSEGTEVDIMFRLIEKSQSELSYKA